MNEKTVTELAFDLVKIEGQGYHIIIEGIVEGNAHNFILDTGASSTIIDLASFSEQIIDKKELSEDEIKSAGVVEGELVSFSGKLKKLSFGNINLELQSFLFIDLSHVNDVYREIAKMEIAGLIGGDFLVEHNAVINYKTKTILLEH